MRLLVAMLMTGTGCGRSGFDALADGSGSGGGGDGRSDGFRGEDGPAALSCGILAPTCGPTGTSPCCESPLVTGGTQPDLAGNVWEWALDGYAALMAAPCTDCANLTATASRVVRGGSWVPRR